MADDPKNQPTQPQARSYSGEWTFTGPFPAEEYYITGTGPSVKVPKVSGSLVPVMDHKGNLFLAHTPRNDAEVFRKPGSAGWAPNIMRVGADGIDVPVMLEDGPATGPNQINTGNTKFPTHVTLIPVTDPTVKERLQNFIAAAGGKSLGVNDRPGDGNTPLIVMSGKLEKIHYRGLRETRTIAPHMAPPVITSEQFIQIAAGELTDPKLAPGAMTHIARVESERAAGRARVDAADQRELLARNGGGRTGAGGASWIGRTQITDNNGNVVNPGAAYERKLLQAGFRGRDVRQAMARVGYGGTGDSDLDAKIAARLNARHTNPYGATAHGSGATGVRRSEQSTAPAAPTYPPEDAGYTKSVLAEGTSLPKSWQKNMEYNMDMTGDTSWDKEKKSLVVLNGEDKKAHVMGAGEHTTRLKVMEVGGKIVPDASGNSTVERRFAVGVYNGYNDSNNKFYVMTQKELEETTFLVGGKTEVQAYGNPDGRAPVKMNVRTVAIEDKAPTLTFSGFSGNPLVKMEGLRKGEEAELAYTKARDDRRIEQKAELTAKRHAAELGGEERRHVAAMADIDRGAMRDIVRKMKQGVSPAAIQHSAARAQNTMASGAAYSFPGYAGMMSPVGYGYGMGGYGLGGYGVGGFGGYGYGGWPSYSQAANVVDYYSLLANNGMGMMGPMGVANRNNLAALMANNGFGSMGAMGNANRAGAQRLASGAYWQTGFGFPTAAITHQMPRLGLGQSPWSGANNMPGIFMPNAGIVPGAMQPGMIPGAGLPNMPMGPMYDYTPSRG